MILICVIVVAIGVSIYLSGLVIYRTPGGQKFGMVKMGLGLILIVSTIISTYMQIRSMREKITSGDYQVYYKGIEVSGNDIPNIYFHGAETLEDSHRIIIR